MYAACNFLSQLCTKGFHHSPRQSSGASHIWELWRDDLGQKESITTRGSDRVLTCCRYVGILNSPWRSHYEQNVHLSHPQTTLKPLLSPVNHYRYKNAHKLSLSWWLKCAAFRGRQIRSINMHIDSRRGSSSKTRQRAKKVWGNPWYPHGLIQQTAITAYCDELLFLSYKE